MKTGAPNSFKKSNCPIQMTPVAGRNEAIDCGKLTASGVSFMEKSDRAFGSGPGLPLPPSPNENEILSLGLSHARQSAPLRAESADEAEQLDLSVVMPCLNERLTLGACIRKAIATMKAMDIRGEVVVADNGSTDGSQAIALEVGARVIAVETRGYGRALRGGSAAARGKYVVMGDADDSYDFTQLADFVNKLNEGYDLVMGNRFQGGIRPGAVSPVPWQSGAEPPGSSVFQISDWLPLRLARLPQGGHRQPATPVFRHGVRQRDDCQSNFISPACDRRSDRSVP